MRPGVGETAWRSSDRAAVRAFAKQLADTCVELGLVAEDLTFNDYVIQVEEWLTLNPPSPPESRHNPSITKRDPRHCFCRTRLYTARRHEKKRRCAAGSSRVVLRLCRERVAHHQRRAGRRDGDARGGERDPGRLLRADGRPRQDPRSRHRAVLQDRAGGERQVPLVRHDDAHLHARQAASLRDAVHRHRRQVGEVGRRQDARSAVRVDVLHADDPPAQHGLVSQEERRDRDRPALQPAGRFADRSSSISSSAPSRTPSRCPSSRKASPRSRRRKRRRSPPRSRTVSPCCRSSPPTGTSSASSPATTSSSSRRSPASLPDTNIELLIDDKLAQSPRHVRTGTPQTFTIELGPTLFVNGMDCVAECDPEMRNGINFRSGPGLMFANVRKRSHRHRHHRSEKREGAEGEGGRARVRLSVVELRPRRARIHAAARPPLPRARRP